MRAYQGTREHGLPTSQTSSSCCPGSVFRSVQNSCVPVGWLLPPCASGPSLSRMSGQGTQRPLPGALLGEGGTSDRGTSAQHFWGHLPQPGRDSIPQMSAEVRLCAGL